MNDIMDGKVYGVDHKKCRFTGLPIESGSGALSADEQAISNLGKLAYDLAELTNRRKDHADTLASAQVDLSNMHARHASQRDDDIVGRQGSVNELAGQDILIANLQRQETVLKTQHEDLAVKIAEVKAKLNEEGVIDRYGMGAAGSWLARINDRGWSLPS
jgi:hypothetical protein